MGERVELKPAFQVCDRVAIDGGCDLGCVVTALIWRGGNVFLYEVSWIAGAQPQCATIEEWRLSRIAKAS